MRSVNVHLGRTPKTSGRALSGVCGRGLAGSMTPEEQQGFMDSMRNAAKNTSFQSWLDATVSRSASGVSETCTSALQHKACGSTAGPGARPDAAGTAAPVEGSLEQKALTDVAPYLQPPSSQPGSSGTHAHRRCTFAH